MQEPAGVVPTGIYPSYSLIWSDFTNVLEFTTNETVSLHCTLLIARRGFSLLSWIIGRTNNLVSIVVLPLTLNHQIKTVSRGGFHSHGEGVNPIRPNQHAPRGYLHSHGNILFCIDSQLIKSVRATHEFHANRFPPGHTYLIEQLCKGHILLSSDNNIQSRTVPQSS